ncbi:hypothetical protein [Micromonospora sp. NPDC049204]|uniref:hypothetical protein n=1 Tax=Micromonospora sp. NPDC049204 TaxID=3154351 RepID=UPI003409EFD3
MAVDWVGAISTGAVGLAGIAGTAWAAGQQRKSAREEAARAVTVERLRLQAQIRREEYLSYLRALESAFDLQNKIRHEYADGGVTQASRLAADAKLVEVIEHAVRLRLCARRPIIDMADHLRKVVAAMFEETLVDGGALLDTYAEAQQELTEAMRADLDRLEHVINEVSGSGEASRRQQEP